MLLEAFFHYDFLRYALITAVFVGFLAPLLGVFIVIRRQALMADALSHITLSGIAFGLFTGKWVPFFQSTAPIYFGMVFSVAGSIFMEQLRNTYRQFQELAVPIILSSGIGLSVVLISLANGFNADLLNYLFGSIVATSRGDMWTIIAVCVICVSLLTFFYKELFLLAMDEEQARVAGVRGNFVPYLFMVMVALVIAVAIQIVGILLVSALMTLPVAAALRLAGSFKQTVLLSILFGEISMVGGLFSAYWFNLAPGGTIVIIAVLLLLVALLWKKRVQTFLQKAGE